MSTNVCTPLKPELVQHILNTYSINPVTAEISLKVNTLRKKVGDILPRNKKKSGGNGDRLCWCYGLRFEKKQVAILGSRISFILYHHRDVTPGLLVDHINGNALDDSKDNLRELTRSQNVLNTRTRKKKGYIGVCSVGDKFTSQISHSENGKKITKWANIKFDTAEEAARWFDKESIALRGEYARTNFPHSDYAELKPSSVKRKCSRFKGVTAARGKFIGQFSYQTQYFYTGAFESEREAFDSVQKLRKELGAPLYKDPDELREVA
ncbi:TPA: HNH endonuclease [Klebsiella aerogenes]|nr:HNH endonuclease [Klebsiella aerogenes]